MTDKNPPGAGADAPRALVVTAVTAPLLMPRRTSAASERRDPKEGPPLFGGSPLFGKSPLFGGGFGRSAAPIGLRRFPFCSHAESVCPPLAMPVYGAKSLMMPEALPAALRPTRPFRRPMSTKWAQVRELDMLAVSRSQKRLPMPRLNPEFTCHIRKASLPY